MDRSENPALVDRGRDAEGRVERPPHIRDLHASLRAAGVFEPASLYYVSWMSLVLGLYLTSYVELLRAPGPLLRLASIALAGIMTTQLSLFAHDVGHGSVTHDRRLKSALGHFANSFLAGFSFSYWQSTHFRHHNHPNTEEIDPDVESPAYALYERAARRARGAGRIVAALQPWSAFLAFPLWGAAVNLSGILYVARGLRRRTALDAACICAHVAMWVVVQAFASGLWVALSDYAAILVVKGLYMAAILVVPHVGMGTRPARDEPPFFERQVRLSRNYGGSWIVSVLTGGLNLQIEHHLLPHVPHVRLRRARRVVSSFCEEHDLPYHQVSYWRAWREVWTHLRRMATLAVAPGMAATPSIAPERERARPDEGAATGA